MSTSLSNYFLGFIAPVVLELDQAYFVVNHI